MLARKKRTLTFFAVMYLVFGGVLLYLLFFGSDLSLEKELTANGEKLYLVNNGSSIIKDIEVVSKTGAQVAYFDELNPGEKKEINVPDDVETITINTAWHIPIVTNVIKTSVGLPLDISAHYPKKVAVGGMFKVTIEICSESQAILKAEANTNKLLKLNDIKEKEITVMANGCSKEDFEFEALNKGNAQIVFKIKTPNSVKDVKLDLVVE